MKDQPVYKPPRKKPKIVSWLAALTAVVLLNVAADSFAATGNNHGWMALLAAFAFLILAVWWARGAN